MLEIPAGRLGCGSLAGGEKIERIDHADDLVQFGPGRKCFGLAGQEAKVAREQGGVCGAADFNQDPLEASGEGKFAQPRRDPLDLRGFIAVRNFEHGVVRAPHRAAETAQRFGVEIERAGVFHQQGQAPSPMPADEVVQERRFARAEKTSHEGDGQAAVHSTKV